MVWLAATVRAYQMPATAVMLDFGHHEVGAELVLPLQELELGFKQPLLEHPEQVLPQHRAALEEYLLAHVHPVTLDGKPWSVEVLDMNVQMKEQPFDLIAHRRMNHPPARRRGSSA